MQHYTSKTLEGHTYLQHGKDLRAFMEALKLKDAIVVGWSYGCHDVYGYFRSFLLQRKITAEELNWLLDQVQKTPNYVATLLAADGSFADYTPEAKMIDGKIPVLNVLSETQAESGKAWLAKHAPHSETVVMGGHWMFHEYPDKFNAALDAFLAKLK